MSEMMSALIVAGVSIIGQLVIGYWWKRGVEAKDEKISKLEERVDEMDTRRITGIEDELQHGKDQRARIYTRLEQCEKREDTLGVEVAHIKDALPQLPQISKELAQTAATLSSVTDRVEQIATQQYTLAQQLAKLEGSIG